MSSSIHTSLRDFHLSPHPARSAVGLLLSRTAATIRLWRKRAREKRLLMQLNERDWHDMGVSQSDIDAELNRPFWRAPPPC
jgi:uncharacterized protein YjiS (DUF1127 family)